MRVALIPPNVNYVYRWSS